MEMTDTLRETLERIIELAEIATNIAAAQDITQEQALEARAALVTGE